MNTRYLMITIAVAACTRSTTDNFVNPTPGPPDTCETIAALPGCDQGSISYACTADRPDSGGDVNLVCSGGVPGGGATTLYCCAPYVQRYTECAPDPTIAGCVGVSIGFACDGATAPSDADPTIVCAAADIDGSYCCNTAAVPATCAVDPTVAGCAGLAIGYSCVDGDQPFAGSSQFACASGSAAGSFCCLPAAGTADTCQPTAPVACPTGQYAFDCAGTATPSGLTCTAGTASGSTTPYCCTP